MPEFNTGQQALIDADINQKAIGIAGAGTGKTTTILERVKQILEKRPDGKVIIISFTRNAAQDVRERLAQVIGEEQTRRVIVGTFHSVIGRIIRENASLVGYTGAVSTLDEPSTRLMVKEAAQQVPEADFYERQVNHFLEGIQLAQKQKILEKYNRVELYDPTVYALPKKYWNQLANELSIMVNTVDPKALATGVFSTNDIMQYQIRAPKVKNVEQHLQDLLTVFRRTLSISQETNTMTYDQILFLGYLMAQADILKDYKQGISHLVVDEYQDTNKIQDEFVRYLSPDRLTLIGDVDQAIYSFRGGDAALMVQHAEEGQTINLNVNYRSYQPILDLANETIKNNQLGASIRKDLVAARPFDSGFDGTKYEEFATDHDEQDELIKQIKYRHDVKDDAYEDMAILVRSRMAIGGMKKKLEDAKIPINDTTGMSDLLTSSSANDLLAFLKVYTNPKDVYAFIEILDKPKRNIGPKALANLRELAKQKDMSLVSYIMSEYPDEDLKTKKTLLKNLGTLRDTYRHLLDDEGQYTSAVTMLKTILDQTGYTAWQAKQANKERLQSDTTELLRIFKEFEDSYKKENPNNSLYELVVSLVMDITDYQKKDHKEGVVLSTIHGSKGLEWENVFLVGMDQGIFPIEKSPLEDERRLFYVALTRAKKFLFLTHARSRVTLPDKELDESSFKYEIEI